MKRWKAMPIVAALLGGAMLLAAVWLSYRSAPPARPSALTVPTSPPEPSASAPMPPQLRGRILDAEGSAVAGAAVRATARGSSVVLAETRTDAGGAFRFDHLGGERIRVEAEHDPGGAVRSAELILHDGGTIAVTLVLSPASLRGVVVDGADGHPVAGATLSVEGVPWEIPGTTSDEGGAFHFAVVPPEATAILAVAGGYRAERVVIGPREDPADLSLRIALRTGPPLDGHVLDPEGRGLRAQVVACEGHPAAVRTESADDGAFRLPASAIGCDVYATHDDMAPSDPVRAVEGSGLTLHLGAGGAIAGSVVDERGAAIDSFSVGVESFAPARGPGTHGNAATPYRGGAFRIEHLVPGAYVLVASAAGKPPARTEPIEVRASTTTDGVRIVLGPGGNVVGRVVDSRKSPIADVVLRFDAVSSVAGSDATAKTDAGGRFRLEGAPAGPFTIHVQREGFRPKLVSGLLVEAGATLTKDITLNPIDGPPDGTEFGGVGASLGSGPGGIVFKGVFSGDPADRAGIREGDRIVRIDGEDTALFSVADAIQRLRGEARTTVGVTIERGGVRRDVLLERAQIIH